MSEARRLPLFATTALAVVACCVALLAIAAPAARAAPAGVPTCGGQPTTLRWEIIREGRRRAIGLRSTGTPAAAIKPIQVLVSRRRGKALEWRSLESQYRYRARPGETVRVGAIFVEDRSNYGDVRQVDGVLGLLPLEVPVVDLKGLVNFLGSGVRRLLPNGLPLGLPNLLDVVAPQVAGGSFAPSACLRVIRKTVAEPTAKRGRARRHSARRRASRG